MRIPRQAQPVHTTQGCSIDPLPEVSCLPLSFLHSGAGHQPLLSHFRSKLQWTRRDPLSRRHPCWQLSIGVHIASNLKATWELIMVRNHRRLAGIQKFLRMSTKCTTKPCNIFLGDTESSEKLYSRSCRFFLERKSNRQLSHNMFHSLPYQGSAPSRRPVVMSHSCSLACAPQPHTSYASISILGIIAAMSPEIPPTTSVHLFSSQ